MEVIQLHQFQQNFEDNLVKNDKLIQFINEFIISEESHLVKSYKKCITGDFSEPNLTSECWEKVNLNKYAPKISTAGKRFTRYPKKHANKIKQQQQEKGFQNIRNNSEAKTSYLCHTHEHKLFKEGHKQKVVHNLEKYEDHSSFLTPENKIVDKVLVYHEVQHTQYKPKNERLMSIIKKITNELIRQEEIDEMKSRKYNKKVVRPEKIIKNRKTIGKKMKLLPRSKQTAESNAEKQKSRKVEVKQKNERLKSGTYDTKFAKGKQIIRNMGIIGRKIELLVRSKPKAKTDTEHQCSKIKEKQKNIRQKQTDELKSSGYDATVVKRGKIKNMKIIGKEMKLIPRSRLTLAGDTKKLQSPKVKEKQENECSASIIQKIANEIKRQKQINELKSRIYDANIVKGGRIIGRKIKLLARPESAATTDTEHKSPKVEEKEIDELSGRGNDTTTAKGKTMIENMKIIGRKMKLLQRYRPIAETDTKEQLFPKVKGNQKNEHWVSIIQNVANKSIRQKQIDRSKNRRYGTKSVKRRKITKNMGIIRKKMELLQSSELTPETDAEEQGGYNAESGDKKRNKVGKKTEATKAYNSNQR